MEYTAVKLVKRPVLNITPDLFEVVKLQTPELEEGQILVKQTHMSLDPAMKGWMMPDTDSYIPPVGLGEVMRSSGLGEVVESRNADFPVGSRVVGLIGWTEYAVSNGEGLNIVPAEIPAEAILCVLSLPGLTAYQGLMEMGKPKTGETIVVSGAAGSVGSLVGQLAKAEGLRVVGTAGSDDKCRWLEEELGFDKAINYKSANLRQALADATPDGVDLYFENTGGEIQHAVFERMNAHGRIIVCGMISDYNTDSPSAGPNWINIVRKRLTIQGFAMPDHWHKIPEMSQKLAEYLMTGKLKYRAHTLHGLESAIEGINLLFTGGNTGKLMVEL
ncbi:NADP-dependent oxidoreductase [Pseudomaricurvus alkylphenolicus]|uniref:NADP-dependent oxidoreductase n=1 Tax=Pseudomaricurvus alkylphenolicus TaxID=1306991 RepID=UPI0014244704|nr:NADP-dependent oxidoreductase [Pseudomaricurvus alkylphenolicus]NIB41573.1 NADP-dependent oxidoreductase [Pseudomaricurvus alkylphenolicus]